MHFKHDKNPKLSQKRYAVIFINNQTKNISNGLQEARWKACLWGMPSVYYLFISNWDSELSPLSRQGIKVFVK